MIAPRAIDNCKCGLTTCPSIFGQNQNGRNENNETTGIPITLDEPINDFIRILSGNEI